MHFINLIHIRIRLCLNALGPFLCIQQWDYTILLDHGLSLGQWSIVATIGMYKRFNNLAFSWKLHSPILDAHHHLISN